MKLFVFAALSAISTMSIAGVEPHAATNGGGHWEWQSTTSYGPRAPLPAPHRVWVADSPAHASTSTSPAHDTSETHQSVAPLKSL